MELKDIYCTFLTLEIIQKSSEKDKENLVSKLNFI